MQRQKIAQEAILDIITKHKGHSTLRKIIQQLPIGSALSVVV